MNKWENFEDFIKALINNEDTEDKITADSFNGLDLKNLQNNKPELWKSFLDFLSKESEKIGHTPLLEADLQNINYENPLLSTVFGYITQKADFNNENLPIDKIQDIIKQQNLKIDLNSDNGFVDANGNNTNLHFWNESMSKLMAKYLNTLMGSIVLDKNGLINIPVSDIKNADAGYLFGYQNESALNEWVKPWHNIDWNTYQEVRSDDKINAVLSSDINLQFTHSQDVHKYRMQKDENGNWIKAENDKWIRLLMPKYLRRVEVEDLNRNFWVIGQTISAVCAYLFGDNGLGRLLKDIINELMELWQNIIYLWATLATLASKPKKEHELHKEVIMLPNNILQPYVKFDDFSRDSSTILDMPHSNENEKELIKNILLPKLTYLKSMYNDNNVFALIGIRDKNYAHNYYGRECYIGIYTCKYNEKEEQEESIQIFTNYIDIDLIADFSNDGTLAYPLNKISNEIGAIKESNKSELTYYYYYPFSMLGQDLALRLENYHAMIRTKIDINVENDFSNYSITFKLYDVSSILKEWNDNKKVDSVEQKTYQEIELNNLVRIAEKNETDNIVIWSRPADKIIKTDKETSEISVQIGYYLGELISCIPSLKEPPEFKLLPRKLQGAPFYYPQFRIVDLLFNNSKEFVTEEEYYKTMTDEVIDGEMVISKEEKYQLDKQAYALLIDTPNILDTINLSHLNKSIVDGGGDLSFLVMTHACGLLMGTPAEDQSTRQKYVYMLANDLSNQDLLMGLNNKNIIIDNITDTLTNFSTNLDSQGYGPANTYGSSNLFKKDKMNFGEEGEPELILEKDCFGHNTYDPLKSPKDNVNIKYYGTVPSGSSLFTDTTKYCAAVIPDNSKRGYYLTNGSGLEKGSSLAFQSGQYVYTYPDYIDYSSAAIAFTEGAIYGGTIDSDILYTINGDSLDEQKANWIIKRTTYCYTVYNKTEDNWNQNFVDNYCVMLNDQPIVITKVAVCYFAPPEQLETNNMGIKKIQSGRMAYKIYDRYEIVRDEDKQNFEAIFNRWNLAKDYYDNNHNNAFYATVRKEDNSSQHMWAYYYPYDQTAETSPTNAINTPNAFLYRNFERLTTNSETIKALYQIPKTTDISNIKDFEQELFKDPIAVKGVIR